METALNVSYSSGALDGFYSFLAYVAQRNARSHH